MNRTVCRRCRTEAGFTLIEALVAIVVLSFGLIAITNLLVVAASSNTVANQGTAAAAVASRELDRLKSLPFVDPRLAPGGNLEADLDDPWGSGRRRLPGVRSAQRPWRPTTSPAATRP